MGVLRLPLKYRLNSLGWYNFEILTRTLLKVIIGPGVETFGRAHDKGRDAYYEEAPYPSTTSRWTGLWIFQAKFSDVESAEILGNSQIVRSE